MAGRSSGETGQESRADQNRVDPALKQPSAESSEASNPWANLAQDGSGQMRKKNTVVSGKGVSAADRAIEALKKRQGNKTGIAKQRIGDDAVVEIQVDGSTSSHRKTKPKSRMPLKDDSDHEDQDEESGANRGPRAFDQRDLVAQAFAGDNVVEVRLSFGHDRNMVETLTNSCPRAVTGVRCGEAEGNRTRRAQRAGHYASWLGVLGRQGRQEEQKCQEIYQKNRWRGRKGKERCGKE
jgi:U3 small nucleolar RNA-associated protein 14